MTILTTLACSVTSAGIVRPSYADIYATFQSQFQAIYGSDSYIDPDSQDGQLLAIVAKAVDDSNAAAVMLYNAYSPSTSQGQALSNNVKINGINRASASNSQAVVRLTGVVGTTVTDGIVQDTDGFQWVIAGAVTIPEAGYIDATATCLSIGAIDAAAGAITQIITATLGWQSVTNPAASSTGAAVETDAALRQRQTNSVARPSRTVLAGILEAVQELDGVTQAVIYENDTNTTDSNTLPAHSIAVVALGGLSSEIANAILTKKTPGCYTYGTTSVALLDSRGIAYTIRYFVPTAVPISVAITIKALTGYNSTIGADIKDSIADFINALPIGRNVDLGRMYLPAQFYGAADSAKFEVNVLNLAAYPASPGAADVVIAFNERATCDIAHIALTVT